MSARPFKASSAPVLAALLSISSATYLITSRNLPTIVIVGFANQAVGESK